MTGKPLTHQQLIELLPWYVNGTLEEGERRLVAEHVETCAGCAEEVAELRELELAVMALGKDEAGPDRDLAGEAAAEIASSEASGGRVVDFFHFAKRPAVWAALAAALILAVLIPGFSHQPAVGDMVTLREEETGSWRLLKTVRGDNMTVLEPAEGDIRLKLELHLGITIQPSRDFTNLRFELKPETGARPLAIAQGRAVDEAFGLRFPAENLDSGYYVLEVYGVPADSETQTYQLLKTYDFKLQRQ